MRMVPFFEIAKSKGCTPAQLALAWMHSRGADVFPIPGTKSVVRLEENAGAYRVFEALTDAEIKAIESAVLPTVGDRYPADNMSLVYNARV